MMGNAIAMTRKPYANPWCFTIRLVVWLSVFGFFASVSSATPEPRQTAADIASQGDSSFAIADFDGDRELDIATVQVGQVGPSNTRYWIHFRLSSGLGQLVPLTAPIGGLRIASRDVNGDSIVDLVVTTAWHELPIAVLLNDGRGHFTLRDPRAFPAIMASEHTSSVAARGNANEIVAALPPVSSSGRCEASDRAALPGHRSSSICPFVSRQENSAPVESVLGRAPPAPIPQS